MSRAANGTYTLPAGNPVVTATVISSTWANTTLSDLATEMTDSLDRSGKGGMLAPLQLSDGAVGAPALTFATETTMGMYRVAAGQIGFSTNSTLRGSVNTTGNWVINAPTSGAGSTFSTTAIANGNSAGFTSPNTAGQSFGVYIQAGTNSSDYLMLGQSAAGLSFFKVRGDGQTSCWEGNNNIGGASLMQIATEESGSFTGTLTGCTTSPTTTINYRRVGTVVTMDIPAVTGTSNATTCTITGLPAGLIATRAQQVIIAIEDNTAFAVGRLVAGAGNAFFTLSPNMSNSTWTAAGTKGTETSTVTYNLS